MFELTHYGGKLVEYPIGELLFPQFVPHMFLRVEFGRVGRQSHQADVFWPLQLLGLLWELAPSTTMRMKSSG